MGCFHESGGWHSGVLSQSQISEALGEDVASLSELLTCAFFNQFARQEHEGSTRCFALSSAMRANLAIAHALWRQARIPGEIAGQIVFSWPQIGTSVAAIVDFEHNSGLELAPDCHDRLDPFRLFEPTADEALPMQVTDEYLDLVDERFLLWRRPEIEPVVTAANLYARSKRVAGDPHDCVARQEFLQQLAGLNRSVCHDRVWLGRIAGEAFLPQPPADGKDHRLANSVFEKPSSAISTLEMNYGTKVSVNISLAARIMKRRALGLRVRIPNATRPW
jgi:hypothetical protein